MSKIQLTKTAAAVSLALCATSGYAAMGINFDPDGAGGTFGISLVRTFDWGSANILARNCVPAPQTGLGGCTLYVQTKLSALLGPAPGEPLVAFDSIGHEFTMVLTVKANSSGIGTQNPAGLGTVISFSDLNLSDTLNNLTGLAGPDGLPDLFGDATSLFQIYYDTTSITQASDVVEGTGYTNGTLILEGSVGIKDFAVTVTAGFGPTAIPLDNTPGSIGESHPTVQSITTTGSANFAINVNPAIHTVNTDFFKDPFEANATLIRIDIDENGRSSSPFTSTEPSKLVGGFAPNYGGDTGTVGLGQYENDLDCETSKASCDFHLEGDPKSIFQHTVVPEPGSVALIGLSLGLLGFSTRKLRKKA